MSIPFSTAPAVKARLVTLFQSVMDVDALAVAGNVLVSYNEPGEQLPDNLIVVGRVERTFAPLRMIGSGGANWGNESYEVEIEISVLHGQLGPQPLEERVWHLIGLMENAVRGDPSLGGLVNIQANPTTSEVQCEWATGEAGGWEGTGQLKIHVEAAL